MAVPARSIVEGLMPHHRELEESAHLMHAAKAQLAIQFEDCFVLSE